MIIHVRLRPGHDDDIAEWYEPQADKAAAVRDAIRAYMRSQNGEGQDAVVRAAVIQAMSELPNLVTGAVRDALASYQFAPRQAERAPGDEDPELAARLDAQLDDFFGD